MVALSAFNTSTGGLAIGDWLYSAKPLAAPEYLPLNDDTASYLSSSYPTLAATYAPTAVPYSAAAITSIPFSSVKFQFVFGNNVFLGWNSNGNIITSTDCVNWTPSGIDTGFVFPATGGGGLYEVNGTNAWRTMTYGKGIFVAARSGPSFPGGGSGSIVGSGSSIGATAVSYDNGITWRQGVLPNTVYTQSTTLYTEVINWQCIAYGNKFFIAIGFSIDYGVSLYYRHTAYSSDGINWSSPAQVSVGAASTPTNTTNIAYGNGVFVYAVADSSTGNQVVYYTTGTPSIAWTATAALPTVQYWTSIAYGNGVFVAVGSGTAGGSNIAATSPTGVTWTSRTLPASLSWVSVTFANGHFVAIGQTYGGSPATTDAVATSTDGITWTLRTTVSANTRVQIAGGNGKFIYMENTGTGSNAATVISLSAAASTFTLPIIPPLPGTQTYMKAT